MRFLKFAMYNYYDLTTVQIRSIDYKYYAFVIDLIYYVDVRKNVPSRYNIISRIHFWNQKIIDSELRTIIFFLYPLIVLFEWTQNLLF